MSLIRDLKNSNQYATAIKLISSSKRFMIIVFMIFVAAGVILVMEGGEINTSLGTAFISSATLSIFLLYIQHLRNNEDLQILRLMQSGISAAFKTRNLSEYPELVANTNSIDVTGYTLRGFSEQNIESIQKRADAGNPIKVRMLLVHPTSPAAQQMERAEGYPAHHYANALIPVVKRLGSLPGVEIRVTQRSISMMIYRIGNTLYTGPYPHSGVSTNALTLRIDQGWIFDMLKDEFENSWKDGAPLADVLTD